MWVPLDEVASGIEVMFGAIDELLNIVQVLPVLILLREVQFRTVLHGNSILSRDDSHQGAFGIGFVLGRFDHDGQGS